MRESAGRDLQEERERLRLTLPRDPGRWSKEEQVRFTAVQSRIDAVAADRFKLSLLLALLAARDARYGDARQRLEGVLLERPDSVAVPLASAIHLLSQASDREAHRHLSDRTTGRGVLERLEAEHPRLRDVLAQAKALFRVVDARVNPRRRRASTGQPPARALIQRACTGNTASVSNAANANGAAPQPDAAATTAPASGTPTPPAPSTASCPAARTERGPPASSE